MARRLVDEGVEIDIAEAHACLLSEDASPDIDGDEVVALDLSVRRHASPGGFVERCALHRSMILAQGAGVWTGSRSGGTGYLQSILSNICWPFLQTFGADGRGLPDSIQQIIGIRHGLYLRFMKEWAQSLDCGL